MSAGAVLLIAVPVLAVLAVVAFVTTARRRDDRTVAELSRETRRADRSEAGVVEAQDVESQARERYAGGAVAEEAGAAPSPAPSPPEAAAARDPEELGMTRRQLFNRGMLATATVAGGGLGAAILAFLWPSAATGFGAKIPAGKVGDILDFVTVNRKPFYVPEARSYLIPYPTADLGKGKQVYDDRLVPGMEVGLVALFQVCPHLGCTVPWCASSQWFECPCHGSKYNRVGEKRGGPAPRGMDRFPLDFDGDQVAIDTGQRIDGPPVGTNTTGQEPEGPHCV